MLSDEEKKALDNMKSLLLYSKEHEYFSPFQEQEIDDMNIVLNIIEKQSKEIEELKDFNTKLQATKDRLDSYDKENTLKIEKLKNKCKELIFEKQELTSALLDSTPNDKIKAKIEEYDKGMTVNLANRSAGKTFQQAVHYEVKKVLQSLLDKE